MEISADQAISDLIQSKSNAAQTKIAFAVAAKQLDSQRSQGDALVALVEQAATVQKQIAAGKLDVRV